jgi:CheY-like chemotaxis protein
MLTAMDQRAFILVAEDEANDAFLFEHTFAGLGIVDYFITTDGAETIAYLEGSREFADREIYPVPDCLLLDLDLPILNGFEILEWLQRHDELRVIPKVVFSGSENPADIRRAYELGANSYFCKCAQIQETIRRLSLIEEYWTVAKYPRLPRYQKPLPRHMATARI